MLTGGFFRFLPVLAVGGWRNFSLLLQQYFKIKLLKSYKVIYLLYGFSDLAISYSKTRSNNLKDGLL